MDNIPQVTFKKDIVYLQSAIIKDVYLHIFHFFRDNLLHTLYAADQAAFVLDHRDVGYHLNSTTGK